MVKRILLMASGLYLVACASSGTTRATPSRSTDVISAEEIAAISVTTAFEAVQRLRPQWLRNRGPTSITGVNSGDPVVYIDEVRAGGLEALERLSIHIVREMRYLSGQDASVRYGLDHDNGAIMVDTVGR